MPDEYQEYLKNWASRNDPLPEGDPLADVPGVEQQLDSNTYVCAMCRGVFSKGRTDEEALAAAEQEFVELPPLADCCYVCDDCWQKVQPRRN